MSPAAAPNPELAQNSGRLLSVRPITDRDRHCVARHHPADRGRTSQADRRAGLSPLRGGEALRHLTEDRPFGKVVLAG